MDLFQHPKNPPFALHLAELLAMLPGAQAKLVIDNRLSQDTGQAVVSHYAAATNDLPAWYAAKSGEWSVVLISGCSLLSHATQTVNGYRGTFGGAVRQPVNNYFQQSASSIFGTASSLSLLTGSKLLLSGHSLGGALVEHLLATLAPARGPGNCVLCTFGAPKPGNEGLANQVAIKKRARWFTSDDPVPLLPPLPGSIPSLLLAHTVFELQRFANFVHPDGGLQLAVDGVIDAGQVPEMAEFNQVGSLAGWLLATDGSSASGHHLASYISRFALWILNNPTNAGEALEPAPAESAESFTRGQYREQTREVTAIVRELSAEQNKTPVSIPVQNVFQYHRAGALHIVTFNGSTVAISARERSARAVAREGNEMLRSLQRQAVVDRTELASQLAAYLTKASTPGTGILPTMNTQLPDDLP